MSFGREDFENALGCFATGVTVVTTRASNGDPVGVTANSFNSVSLNPPLVLFSLARSAYSLGALQDHRRFAVNILGEDQSDLAQRFAATSSDKWRGVEHSTGQHSDCPVLPGCVASFECQVRNAYDGGSHLIVVGEVLDFHARADAKPLMYYRGAYENLAPDRYGISQG